MSFSKRQVLISANEYFLAKAKHEDLEVILEMSENVLSGFDYLKPIFKQWIDIEEKENTRLNLVLLDKEKKVVGFQSFGLLHGFEAVFSQALRIHPSLRGKGVGRIFLSLSHQYLKSKFNEVLIFCSIYKLKKMFKNYSRQLTSTTVETRFREEVGKHTKFLYSEYLRYTESTSFK